MAVSAYYGALPKTGSSPLQLSVTRCDCTERLPRRLPLCCTTEHTATLKTNSQTLKFTSTSSFGENSKRESSEFAKFRNSMDSMKPECCSSKLKLFKVSTERLSTEFGRLSEFRLMIKTTSIEQRSTISKW